MAAPLPPTPVAIAVMKALALVAPLTSAGAFYVSGGASSLDAARAMRPCSRRPKEALMSKRLAAWTIAIDHPAAAAMPES